jgi:hypothetical protein
LSGEGGEDMFVRRKRKTSLASFHAEMVCFMSCYGVYRVQGFTGLVEFVTAIGGQYERCYYNQVSFVCIVVNR